jgi:hypothetical protein
MSVDVPVRDRLVNAGEYPLVSALEEAGCRSGRAWRDLRLSA